jgi:Nuclease-related domain
MREALRRQERREKRTISAHPRIGKFILAVTDEPQTTRAWQKGGAGEQALGHALEAMRDEHLGVLHDRRIPGTKANIDHIVIGPAGVFVIDAKRYSGKLERRDRGWILDRDWRIYVGGRDQTKLVAGMTHQIEAVRTAVVATEFADVRLFPVLCFIDCEVGLFASPFAIGDVRVMWPKPLYALVRSEGLLQREQIADLERALALALPCA